MLDKELSKLGLSDKEAKVYLAALELGPSPVQIISQKSKVNRATTYVIIDSLMEMGLMSTFEEGKKTFFTAEPPERLLSLLKTQENQVKEKIQILTEKMPELKSLVNNISDKPKVKYFEGLEGLRTVQLDVVNTISEGGTMLTFLPLDDYLRTNLKDTVADISEKRLKKKINSLVIYTSQRGRQIEYEKEGEIKLKKYLYVPYEQYPFNAGINIYGDKIFVIDYSGKTGGIVIENKAVAGALRCFFMLLWQLIKNNEELS